MKALFRCSIALAAIFCACLASAETPVRVASKGDTEGSLLGNMILLILKRENIPVADKISLGPTKIVRTAILSGEIDIYPEYTGNGAFFFSQDKDPVWKDARGAFERVKSLDEKNKLVWLSPARANNTWAIAMRKDVAGKENIVSLEDFARFINGGGAIKIAASSEFVESAGALPAFQKAYGFALRGDQMLVFSGGDTSAAEQAAANGTSGVNAAMAYGTDGQLAALGLVILRDTKNVQPVYEPAPLVRESILAAYPKIAPSLAPVFQSLSLETLQDLNAKIAVDGQDARSVASDYLKAKGFLK